MFCRSEYPRVLQTAGVISGEARNLSAGCFFQTNFSFPKKIVFLCF